MANVNFKIGVGCALMKAMSEKSVAITVTGKITANVRMPAMSRSVVLVAFFMRRYRVCG